MSNRLAVLRARAAAAEEQARNLTAGAGEGGNPDSNTNIGDDNVDDNPGDDNASLQSLLGNSRQPIKKEDNKGQGLDAMVLQLQAQLLAEREAARQRDAQLASLSEVSSKNQTLQEQYNQQLAEVARLKKLQEMASFDPFAGVDKAVLEQVDENVLAVLRAVASNARSAAPDVEGIVTQRVNDAQTKILGTVDGKLNDSTFQLMIRSDKYGVPDLDEITAEGSEFLEFVTNSKVRTAAFKAAARNKTMDGISTIRELAEEWRASVADAGKGKQKVSPRTRGAQQTQTVVEDDSSEINLNELEKIRRDARSSDPKVKAAAQARFEVISKQAERMATNTLMQ